MTLAARSECCVAFVELFEHKLSADVNTKQATRAAEHEIGEKIPAQRLP